MEERKDIFSTIAELDDLIYPHIASGEFILQFLSIALAIFIARWLAALTLNIPDYGSVIIKKIKENKILAFREICFYLYLFMLIEISQQTFLAIQLDSWFVTIFLVVVSLWFLLRSSVTLSTYSPKTRALTLGVWVFMFVTFFGNHSKPLEFIKGINFYFGEDNISALFIMEIVVTFVVLAWAAQFLNHLLKKSIDGSEKLSLSLKVLFKELLSLAVYVFAIVLGLTSLGIDLAVLKIFAGTLGFGVGIGLSKTISNFISGLVLLVDKSVKPGDLLLIDGVRGTVDRMMPRCISVLTRDGQTILVPNESLMNEKVRNLSYDNTNLQLTMAFSVNHGSDLRHVNSVVEDMLKNNPDIIQTPAPYCYVSELNENAIKFEMKYWIDEVSSHRSALNNDLWIDLIKTFEENNISLYIKSSPAPPKKAEPEAPVVEKKPTKKKKD